MFASPVISYQSLQWITWKEFTCQRNWKLLSENDEKKYWSTKVNSKSIEETAMSDMSFYINKYKDRQMTRYRLIHYKKMVNIHKSDPFKQKVGFIIQT